MELAVVIWEQEGYTKLSRIKTCWILMELGKDIRKLVKINRPEWNKMDFDDSKRRYLEVGGASRS